MVVKCFVLNFFVILMKLISWCLSCECFCGVVALFSVLSF